MNYRKRIVDSQVSEQLKANGALLIEGPKWCGKTWTGKHFAKSIVEIASPEGNFRNREMAKIDPASILGKTAPELIDEWQVVQSIWDAVRYDVDRTGKKGQYILTGSSTPQIKTNVHSGTGRFGSLRMRTMTLEELGLSEAQISLGKLLSSGIPKKISPVAGKLSLNDVTEMVTRGGWPGLIGVKTPIAQKTIEAYVDSLVENDLAEVDSVSRDPVKLKSLFRSLSRNTASLVSNETIRKDIASSEESSVGADTIIEYLNVLKRVFILDEIAAWEPALKSTVRLRKAPKRILTDPSLAVAALGANPESLKLDLKLLGNLFENLVLHNLLVFAGANDASVYHYSDNSDLEVDAIVENRSGKWGAIEIKLSHHQEAAAANSLIRLRDKMAIDGQSSPEFLMVITGVNGMLHIREDGVVVVPIDLIGA